MSQINQEVNQKTNQRTNGTFIGSLFRAPARAERATNNGFSKIIDAEGKLVALIPVAQIRTYDEATQLSAEIAASLNLCADLPMEGIEGGRYTVVDVNPDTPFSVLQPKNPVPRARLENAIIQLLSTQAIIDDLQRAQIDAEQHEDADKVFSLRESLLRQSMHRAALLVLLADLVGLPGMTAEEVGHV